MKQTKTMLAAIACAVTFSASAFAATPVAEYTFNNNLNSDIGSAPALVATDPLGLSGFQTDSVFGVTQQVFHFQGNTTPAQQAGLSLNTNGLIANDNYSVQAVFKFSDRNSAWRRIIDVQNRQSDNGFYVDPGNNLDIYPVAGSSAAFSTNAYHNVVLTDSSSGIAKFYLDGILQGTINTTVMHIDSNDTMNFFLDNVVGGGQGEYSSGNVALIRVYDAVLTDSEVHNLGVSAVPEASTYALMLAGLGLLGFAVRRKSV